MTDVYLQPRREIEVDRTYQTELVPVVQNVNIVDTGVPLQQTEMAAFEKGRMQGEMEAIRRMEAAAPLKVMQPVAVLQPVDTAIRPDVIEINRLTWMQRISWGLGELTALGVVALTVAWMLKYRSHFGWGMGDDALGNTSHYNVGVLTFALGLWLHSQAISNYRVMPLQTPAMINSLWYCAMTSCAIVCYAITLAAIIMTSPEADFWSADNWVLVAALAAFVPHALWSMFRALTHKVAPVKYETWAEVDSHLDDNSGRVMRDTRLNADGSQHRDALALHANDPRRTVYTPAPINLARESRAIPAVNHNVGAQVPVAPANAPRWAENPNTHAEDYFLLWRAKWAVVAYAAMGTAFLMLVAGQQHVLAAGQDTWSQYGARAGGPLDEVSRESHLISALGLLIMGTVAFISYMAMPPRTTLVKNGILTGDALRRNSISHNAETQLHNNNNINNQHIV